MTNIFCENTVDKKIILADNRVKLIQNANIEEKILLLFLDSLQRLRNSIQS